MDIIRKFKERIARMFYFKTLKAYIPKEDVNGLRGLEDLFRHCKVKIVDYTNCKDIKTTLGLTISYGNKDFHFYEVDNKGLSTGVRIYNMDFDGSGVIIDN